MAAKRQRVRKSSTTRTSNAKKPGAKKKKRVRGRKR